VTYHEERDRLIGVIGPLGRTMNADPSERHRVSEIFARTFPDAVAWITDVRFDHDGEGRILYDDDGPLEWEGWDEKLQELDALIVGGPVTGGERLGLAYALHDAAAAEVPCYALVGDELVAVELLVDTELRRLMAAGDRRLPPVPQIIADACLGRPVADELGDDSTAA
jgi:hypothetical protein